MRCLINTNVLHVAIFMSMHCFKYIYSIEFYVPIKNTCISQIVSIHIFKISVSDTKFDTQYFKLTFLIKHKHKIYIEYNIYTVSNVLSPIQIDVQYSLSKVATIFSQELPHYESMDAQDLLGTTAYLSRAKGPITAQQAPSLVNALIFVSTGNSNTLHVNMYRQTSTCIYLHI